MLTDSSTEEERQAVRALVAAGCISEVDGKHCMKQKGLRQCLACMCVSKASVASHQLQLTGSWFQMSMLELVERFKRDGWKVERWKKKNYRQHGTKMMR